MFNIPKILSEPYTRLMTSQPQLATFGFDAGVYFLPATEQNDPPVHTALTNCRDRVWVNLAFLTACRDGQKGRKGADVFVLAHELMHIMLFHDMWNQNLAKNGIPVTKKLLARIRRHNPHTAWREGMTLFFHPIKSAALDFVINAVLVKFGLKVYPDALCLDPAIATWKEGEDDAYASCFGKAGIEPEDEATGGAGRPMPGIGGDQPGCGGDDTCPGEGPRVPGSDGIETVPDNPASTMRRKLAVAQALEDIAAKGRGVAPGDMQLLLDRLVPNKLRWRELIQLDVKAASGRGASTWSRIKPRSLTMGTVLPGRVAKRAGKCVFQVDISGSVGLQQKRQFAGALHAAMRQVEPKELIVLDVDSRVQQVRVPKNPEELVRMLLGDGFKGGGGTDMTAGFRWCEQEGIEPDLLCTLTDGDTPFPTGHTPAKRALWVISEPGVHAPTAAGVSVYMPLDG